MMEENKYKIIFIGAARFAVPTLGKLIDRGYQTPLIITQPDRPAGREKKIVFSPLKQFALKQGLKISQPEKIAAGAEEIKKINPDLIIVASYGQLIPQKIIELPRFKAVNIHPSLLPKYRGPSPIQTAILNGDKKTGVTLMLMDEKLDHGPIIGQKEILIGQDDDYPALEKKLARLSADFAVKTLPAYLDGKIKPKPQDESRAAYTEILTRQDGKIDWSESAEKIRRKIRAFRPWPGAWTELNGRRVKIIKAEAVKNRQPGAVKTGGGFLVLKEVQPAGKKIMSGEEFLRGYPAAALDR